MPGMTCKCCREAIDFVTFAEANTGKCGACNTEHNLNHPAGWRDAAG